MAGIMWIVSFVSRYRRLASVGIASVCISLSVPQEGNCAPAADILNSIETADISHVQKAFKELETTVCQSQDKLSEARIFFQALVNEINTKYGMSLTVPEAYQLIRRNLHTLQFSEETQRIVLAAVDLIENGSFELLSETPNHEKREVANGCYWPWDWNWFGLNKKDKKIEGKKQYVLGTMRKPSNPSDELPGDCYLGGVELLAGALICLIPHPVATWIGGVMVADGFRRVGDGALELSNKRVNDPNFVPPSPPYGE